MGYMHPVFSCLLSLYIPFRRLFYKLMGEKKKEFYERRVARFENNYFAPMSSSPATQQPLCISQRPATCYIIMLLIIIMMIIAGSVIAATTVSFLCNPLDSPPPYVHIKMVIAFCST